MLDLVGNDADGKLSRALIPAGPTVPLKHCLAASMGASGCASTVCIKCRESL